MKFTIDGKHYDIELDSLTLDEGELIEDHARCSLPEFITAIRETRVRAIRTLVLIAKRRAGETCEWADLGSLDLMDLAASIITDNGIDLTAASEGRDPAEVAALADFMASRTGNKPKTRPRR